MYLRIILSVALALVIASCSKDPNEQANKLFVEAQQLVDKAGQQRDAADKLASLLAAQDRLKSIVAEYPAANLAVQLSSGQSIGKISLSGLANAIADANRDVCFATPKRECLLAEALRDARLAQDMNCLFSAGNMSFPCYTKADLLTDVAVDEQKSGDGAAANKILSEAFQANGGALDAGLLLKLPTVGRGIDAEKLIPPTAAVQTRLNLLVSVAQTEAHNGQQQEAIDGIKRAMSEVGSVHDDKTRGLLLGAIARAQAAAGLNEEALKTVAEARTILEPARQRSLVDGATMARLEADAGNIGAAKFEIGMAKNFIGIVPDLHERFSQFFSIAQVEAELGDPASADDLQSAIGLAQASQSKDNDLLQYFSTLEIAPFPIDEGRIIPTIQSETNPVLRAAFYSSASVAQSKLGHMDSALRLARAAEGPPGESFYVVKAFAAIASAQTKAGRAREASDALAEAIKTLSLIQNPAALAEALVSIAYAVPE